MPMTLNRNAIPVLAIVAATGLTVTACNKEQREDAKTAVTDTADKAVDATKDAAEHVKGATADAKDAFVETAGEQIDNLETQIDEFVTRVRENRPDATAEINRVRDELNNAIANAKVELEQVRNATAEGWKDASARFQDMLAEVQRSFTQVKEQFSGASPETPG